MLVWFWRCGRVLGREVAVHGQGELECFVRALAVADVQVSVDVVAERWAVVDLAAVEVPYFKGP